MRKTLKKATADSLHRRLGEVTPRSFTHILSTVCECSTAATKLGGGTRTKPGRCGMGQPDAITPCCCLLTAFVALWLAYAAGLVATKRSADASDVQDEDLASFLPPP